MNCNYKGNSKGIDKDGQTITADEFEYDKLKNIKSKWKC